ncbi:hypothetical protein WOLCODRAFT_136990 [Wolfiporia cocos MD-104 SS10]|uniref:Uncharacterized protein n=1 Tax=Wolfiporia cocos (strain MD-104) TaxID=742152 RepID=A0A2H3JVP6_WOLCO|nr:hypothetical protein WOLCODRAFT_136990 [Wolfiporia cocos MD-104 SS10]
MPTYHSRPPTPDSAMTSSLHRATSTIDELTMALSDFSRVSSPEPPDVSVCCCGKDDCETTRAWSAWKAKMESRLILSAEVGQALLERHEAFVRRHEAADHAPLPAQLEAITDEEHVDARIADLVKQNAVLEKRLTQALVNNEVAEASNKHVLEQLQEAQSTITRLTSQQARSIGWENRLAIALQEKDDLQQERDSAAQRAKLAESRISALNEKCAKLQAHMTRLREDFEMQCLHRQELSQEVLLDARQRLAQLQRMQHGNARDSEDAEMTKVLETLVADNEALKHDKAELQNLLTEAREDLRTLQEELDERRANDSSYLRHRHTNSSQSVSSHLAAAPSPLSYTFHVGGSSGRAVSPLWRRRANSVTTSGSRAGSTERTPHRPVDPKASDTERRSASPAASMIPSETTWTSVSRPRFSSTHRYEIDHDASDGRPLSPERPRAQRSIYLITRSRGVQTDGASNGISVISPSPYTQTFGEHLSTSTPHDGRSDSSSIGDGQSGAIGVLIERVTMLLNRLTQADALTLTNRLKRQRLLGADVSHLSRTTVSSILQEAATLRSHFRAFLEDEKATLICTRRDLRALFKLFKDMFAEMGQMRVTLNDVILDPTVAGKVSDMAMNPSKAAAAEPLGGDAAGTTAPSSWIAPISKLLGLPGGASTTEAAATRALSPPIRPGNRALRRMPSRIVPKREAALSASSMTVNVEFSGTSAGRSVTSTYSAHPGRQDSISVLDVQSLLSQPAPLPPQQNVSRNVMNIFAGAPRAEDGADPWIVVPKANRPIRDTAILAASGTATLGRRSTMRHPTSQISRTVDAMIDSSSAQERGEEQDVVPKLLERTLSHRGLSDSSIHTSFLNHGEEQVPASPRRSAVEESPGQDRDSVLQALSRRMQAFRFGGPGVSVKAETGPTSSRPETPISHPDGRGTPKGMQTPSNDRAMSPESSNLFPAVTLSPWAATSLDPMPDPSVYLAASPREEVYMPQTWARERNI